MAAKVFKTVVQVEVSAIKVLKGHDYGDRAHVTHVCVDIGGVPKHFRSHSMLAV